MASSSAAEAVTSPTIPDASTKATSAQILHNEAATTQPSATNHKKRHVKAETSHSTNSVHPPPTAKKRTKRPRISAPVTDVRPLLPKSSWVGANPTYSAVSDLVNAIRSDIWSLQQFDTDLEVEKRINRLIDNLYNPKLSQHMYAEKAIQATDGMKSDRREKWIAENLKKCLACGDWRSGVIE